MQGCSSVARDTMYAQRGFLSSTMVQHGSHETHRLDQVSATPATTYRWGPGSVRRQVAAPECKS